MSDNPKKRCRHPHNKVNASLKKDSEWVTCLCECGQGWRGPGYTYFTTSGRRHSPPKWVIRAVQQLKPSFMLSSKARRPKPRTQDNDYFSFFTDKRQGAWLRQQAAKRDRELAYIIRECIDKAMDVAKELAKEKH